MWHITVPRNFNYNCNINYSFHILLISLLQQVRYITGLPRKPLVALARTLASTYLAPKPSSSVIFVARVRLRSLSLRGYSTYSRTWRLSTGAHVACLFCIKIEVKRFIIDERYFHKPGLLCAIVIKWHHYSKVKVQCLGEMC